jgi:hypothetical protein
VKYLKKASIMGVALALFLLTGIVFAAWVVTGSGTGSAKAKRAVDLSTQDAAASTVEQLYPGGSGDVKVIIKNDNPFPVTVTKVDPNGPVTSPAAGCTTTGVTFTAQTVSETVAANGGTTAVTLTNAASMDNTSDSACQGATFDIPVKFTASS